MLPRLRPRCSRQHRAPGCPSRSRALQPLPCTAARSSKRPDQPDHLAPERLEQLRSVLLAAAVACTFVSNVGAARADAWLPRRHHRHIGERFTDTWADSIVEVEQLTASRVRDLERQLEYERKRADTEATKRREVEQKLKVVTLQQKSARKAADDDAWVQIKVAGADLTGPLAFLVLFGGVYFGWQQQQTAAARQKRGRWVYDRGLGGKKIWVPNAGSGGELPQQLSDAAFDELTSKAAAKSAAAARQQQQQPYRPPEWWQPPMSFAADAATRAAAQLQASAILSRIEQAKNRGQDYALSDIALMRKTCQAGGGVTVDTRTVGGRDAIYKAAVDAATRRCLEPSMVEESDLADSTPLQFVAGVAQDLQIPDERAISMAANWVAGQCRSRIVEAYTAAKKGDEISATTALYQLASLLQGLPILEPGSSQVDLIAEELGGWADQEVLQQLRDIGLQLLAGETQQQQMLTAMLGL